jgi:hypothetical protein
MLHGRDHDTVRAQAQNISLQISQRFPGVLHDHDILFSTAILKKTGLRLRRP